MLMALMPTNNLFMYSISKSVILCLAALLHSIMLLAMPHSLGKAKGKASKASVANMAEEDYDVKYLKFRLNVTDTSTYVSGNVTTVAQVVASTMTDYYFELDTTMTIDSAFINGVSLPVTTVGTLRKMTISAPLVSGQVFSARVVYHGFSVGDHGLIHAVTTNGTNVAFTACEPYYAKNWWPCKQSLRDKIDSVDMYVTTQNNVGMCSNGLQVSVDSVSYPGYKTHYWKSRYAIDYYLISIAIGNFTDYKRYVHFTGSTDSMLLHNFLIDSSYLSATDQANFDSMAIFIDDFSKLFNRYPFWKEKYGICFVDAFGGMENQTMTLTASSYVGVLVHELGHHWFGNHVTMNSWADIWLSEGFASWFTQFYFSQYWSSLAGRTTRTQFYAPVLRDPCCKVIVADTLNEMEVFSNNVYCKGAAIINMLRYAAPSDSLFFSALSDYQRIYANSTASANDLKTTVEHRYGISLDTFFNQWVYGGGFPQYTVTWNQVGSTVFVKLIQQASCPAVTPHYSTFIQLQLKSATADTFIKVYNSLDTQIFAIDWSETVVKVMLNPDVWTLCKQLGPIKKDLTLQIAGQKQTGVIVRNNPSVNYWQVENIAVNTPITLLNLDGIIVWKGVAETTITTIPCDKLPAGAYMLQVGDDNSTKVIKLVKLN